jgi:hypothetical protein
LQPRNPPPQPAQMGIILEDLDKFKYYQCFDTGSRRAKLLHFQRFARERGISRALSLCNLQILPFCFATYKYCLFAFVTSVINLLSSSESLYPLL